jgi:hypothetical protein
VARNVFCAAAAVDERQLLSDGVELRDQSVAVLEIAGRGVVDPIGQDLDQSSPSGGPSTSICFGADVSRN